MRPTRPTGPYADVMEARSPLDPEIPIKLGITHATFRRYQQRGLFAAIAQYYGIVQDGLPEARHAFRGLRRPLAVADDMKADQGVIVYSWRSQVDYEWQGSPQEGKPKEYRSMRGLVFVVLTRPQRTDEHGVSGSIERWNWVREDASLEAAPVDWKQRYGQKMWSRSYE